MKFHCIQPYVLSCSYNRVATNRFESETVYRNGTVLPSFSLLHALRWPFINYNRCASGGTLVEAKGQRDKKRRREKTTWFRGDSTKPDRAKARAVRWMRMNVGGHKTKTNAKEQWKTCYIRLLLDEMIKLSKRIWNFIILLKINNINQSLINIIRYIILINQMKNKIKITIN